MALELALISREFARRKKDSPAAAPPRVSCPSWRFSTGLPGATKSGGTTRRAAKMVCLDMDHPEIADFINWKRREENKARTLAGGQACDFDEAVHTVSGQNANNSVRVTRRVHGGLREGRGLEDHLPDHGPAGAIVPRARPHEQIAQAAWECGDPGLQYDSTINRWHTCKITDRINASNPCSEYMFLDDSACNLASLNLMKFLDPSGAFDVEAFKHAVGSSSRPRKSSWTLPPTPPSRSPGTATTTAPSGSATPTWVPFSWLRASLMTAPRRWPGAAPSRAS